MREKSRATESRIDSHGLTHAGKEKTVNEDQFLVAELTKALHLKQSSLDVEDETQVLGGPQGQLFLVADGVGGLSAGDRASRVAAGTAAGYVLNLMPWFFGLDTAHGGELREELRTLFEECQARVRTAAGDRPGGRMATTLTLAYVLWPNAYVVHAGDSRCYVCRGDRIEQITTDHTIAQKLADEGVRDGGAVEESRLSHALWNVLGGPDEKLHTEVYRVQLRLGDTLLLATDGLTRHVDDAALLDFLRVEERAKETAVKLVNAANAAGGLDNVTVVVVRFHAASDAAGLYADEELEATRSRRRSLPRSSRARGAAGPALPQPRTEARAVAQRPISDCRTGIDERAER